MWVRGLTYVCKGLCAWDGFVSMCVWVCVYVFKGL